MKNEILGITRAFGVCMLLTASHLCAQSDRMFTAHVPFDFTVGNQHFAAGRYSVTTDWLTASVLIQSEESNARRFVLTIATSRSKSSAQAQLVFTRYEEKYFLFQVWPPGVYGRELRQSRTEEELVARGRGNPAVATLAVPVPLMPNH